MSDPDFSGYDLKGQQVPLPLLQASFIPPKGQSPQPPPIHKILCLGGMCGGSLPVAKPVTQGTCLCAK